MSGRTGGWQALFAGMLEVLLADEVLPIKDGARLVSADRHRHALSDQPIREVLMHLLDNAGKYSDLGTPIKVNAEVKSDRLVISVSDRGSGFDSLEQSLIFDKFCRGGRQGYTAPGAGMGLPIAKTIVGAHRGTIGLVSQLGQGSVFSISVPNTF